jgi:TniQ
MNTSMTTPFSLGSTSPLLQRTALWPNESLASVLERLRQLNFYTRRNLLTTVGRERLAALNIEDELDQPTQLETFQQLASLTHLMLDELYAASDQRFAGEPGPLAHISEPMPWLANTLRSRLDVSRVHDLLRSRSSASFCPLCLKAAAYQRLSWIPRATAICLEHRCLLRDRCSRCWAQPTVADLVNRRCSKCKADLSRMRSVSIAQDSLGFQSQQLIQSWFNVADISRDVIEASHLPPQPPSVLYRLLQLLARALLYGQAEWSTLPYPLNGLATPIAAAIDARKRLTPEQAYFLYRSAFAGLLDWPQGLYRTLDVYAGYDDLKTPTPPRLRYVQRVQHDWLTADWQSSPLAFVQRDLLEYVLTRGLPLMSSVLEHLQDVPWFIERTGLWTEEQTSRLLDLSLTDLHRFFYYSNSSLSDCLIPHARTHKPRFKRAAVLAVKQRWATGWSLHDVSSWLHLNSRDVLRLVEIGLLPIDGMWGGDDEQGLFNPQTVKDFYARVVAQLKPWPNSWCDLISMSRAVAEVDWLDVDLAVLVQSVLAGRVLGHQRPPQIESLYQIYFSQTAIFKLPDQIYAARGWTNGFDFAHEYGFPYALVRDWASADLIEPQISFGSRSYFDRQQLKELAAQHGFLSPIVQPSRKRRT